MDPFFPPTYELPKKDSQYLDLKEGNYKIRILTAPTIGYEGWKGKEPIRKRPTETFANTPVDKPPVQFLAFLVWDYTDEKFKTLVLKQKTVIGAIYNFNADPDFGDPRGYDIKISRLGKTKDDTKYTVIPMGQTPLKEEIKDAFKKLDYNLDRLFQNEPPISEVATMSDVASVSKDDLPW